MSDRAERKRCQKSWIFFSVLPLSSWDCDQNGFPCLLALLSKIPTQTLLKLYLNKSNFEALSVLRWKYEVLIHSYYHNNKECKIGSFIYLIYINFTLCNALLIIFQFFLFFLTTIKRNMWDLTVHGFSISSTVIKWTVITITTWKCSSVRGQNYGSAPIWEGV